MRAIIIVIVETVMKKNVMGKTGFFFFLGIPYMIVQRIIWGK